MSLSNSQYQAIMRIYNERQYQDRYEQDIRRREVYEKLPQVKAIEEELGSQAVTLARLLLDGDEKAAEASRRRTEQLRQQKAELMAGAGYPADYMEMRYHCPECRDTGYVERKRCRCFRREQMRLLYAQSNIEAVLERENFDTFTYRVYDDRKIIPGIEMTAAQYMRQVRGWCMDFVENFEQKGGNLIFTGSTGVGKTFLTHCIAKALIDRYQSVVYLSSGDLFDIFSKNKFHYEPEDDAQDMYSGILDCDLLIIDDLGTELNNSFVSSQLFYCVNERLNRGKSTVISTNLSMSMLRDAYSDRVSSRIVGRYTIIPLYGDDIRTKRQVQLDEISR